VEGANNFLLDGGGDKRGRGREDKRERRTSCRADGKGVEQGAKREEYVGVRRRNLEEKKESTNGGGRRKSGGKEDRDEERQKHGGIPMRIGKGRG